jgi:hypothetical protein
VGGTRTARARADLGLQKCSPSTTGGSPRSP